MRDNKRSRWLKLKTYLADLVEEGTGQKRIWWEEHIYILKKDESVFRTDGRKENL